jgi:penicillin-binding protein 2
MARHDPDLAERSGHLVEEHQALDPRVVFFHFAIAALLALLAGGLAYQQLFRSGAYHQQERRQNERRIIMPGARGEIYDRDGRLLVGNRPRYAVVLYLDELQGEFRREVLRIRRNYRETGDRDLPTSAQIEEIARVSVVQRYLDRVDAILGRNERVDPAELRRHFSRQLLLPYVLVDDLSPEEFARLIEHLPANSPLQIYASDTRTYPYGALASHVLGFVGIREDLDAGDMPAGDLTTFRMPGTVGRDGLEKAFDAELQGRPGVSIVRVDPAGYTVSQPVAEPVWPRPGRDLRTSIDLDLQRVAEQAIGANRIGSAVALDAQTGEVLVLASMPDYDLNEFSPHLSRSAAADIQKRDAWIDLAIAGLYPPGSTFKTVVTIAGLQDGRLDPDDTSVDCNGSVRVGNRIFHDDGVFGHIDLAHAIAVSSDVYFYEHGLRIGPEAIAAEARRFHLDRPTGIRLPGETRAMIIPTPAWKRRVIGASWTDGDTANMSIGQGYVRVTPLEMACYAASLARGQTSTYPYLVHEPGRPPQDNAPIGLTPEQRAVLLQGMLGCTTYGTARILTTVPGLELPGIPIAGKTGTAQFGNKLDVAWFICFAPIENPQIAVAVAVQGQVKGETYAGSFYAAPVADAILKAYFEKKGELRPESPASGQTDGSPSPDSPSPGP